MTAVGDCADSVCNMCAIVVVDVGVAILFIFVVFTTTAFRNVCFVVVDVIEDAHASACIAGDDNAAITARAASTAVTAGVAVINFVIALVVAAIIADITAITSVAAT